MLLSSQQQYTRKCSPILASLKSCSRLAGRTASLHVFLLHTEHLRQHFKEEPKGRRVGVSSSGFLKEERMQEVPLWVVLAEYPQWAEGKPCFIQDHGKCMKGMNNPSVLWKWGMGWMEELSSSELSSSEVVTALAWTTFHANITFTDVYCPQRTQIMPKGKLTNF